MLLNYPGPRSRRPPGAALELDAARWCYMPKLDGVAARVRLDERGAIASVMSRAGLELRDGRDLIGIVAGFPDSILWGELESLTEASNRAVAARGWRCLHLWDAERSDGRDLSRLPFASRWGEIHRGQGYVDGERQHRDRGADRLDVRGVRHDDAGRFAPRTPPHDLRRVLVVPLHRGVGAGVALWAEHVHRGGGEGVVAARLDAPIGSRLAKVKIRDGRTIDAVVVAVDCSAAVLVWAGRTFTVAAAARHDLHPGDVVEVAIDGFTEATSTPKHARIVRARPDLTPATRNPPC